MSQTDFTQIARLYDEESYLPALNKALEILVSDAASIEALCWTAWCRYRLCHFQDAAGAIATIQQLEKGNQQAQLCKAYLLADKRYWSGGLSAAVDALKEVADPISVASAYVDFARDENSYFWREFDGVADRVLILVPSVLRTGGIDPARVGVLLVKTAEMLAEAPRNDRDRLMALGFIQLALVKYEGTEEENKARAHLRAEALHLASLIHELMLDLESAIKRKRQEVGAWADAMAVGVISRSTANHHRIIANACYERLVQEYSQMRQ